MSRDFFTQLLLEPSQVPLLVIHIENNSCENLTKGLMLFFGKRYIYIINEVHNLI